MYLPMAGQGILSVLVQCCSYCGPAASSAGYTFKGIGGHYLLILLAFTLN